MLLSGFPFLFQFQNGAIKSDEQRIAVATLDGFQFQNGAIKR